MVEQSQEIGELAKALSLAQSQIEGASKDKLNPHFRSKYADLASVWDACRSALTSNGLSVVQMPGFVDGFATLDTMLLHTSGQWVRSQSASPLVKQDPQGVGSALTYLRRYALAAVVGVCPEDDDGNAASTAPKQRQKPKAVEAAPNAADEAPHDPAWEPEAPPRRLSESQRAQIRARIAAFAQQYEVEAKTVSKELLRLLSYVSPEEMLATDYEKAMTMLEDPQGAGMVL